MASFGLAWHVRIYCLNTLKYSDYDSGIYCYNRITSLQLYCLDQLDCIFLVIKLGTDILSVFTVLVNFLKSTFEGTSGTKKKMAASKEKRIIGQNDNISQIGSNEKLEQLGQSPTKPNTIVMSYKLQRSSSMVERDKGYKPEMTQPRRLVRRRYRFAALDTLDETGWWQLLCF